MKKLKLHNKKGVVAGIILCILAGIGIANDYKQQTQNTSNINGFTVSLGEPQATTTPIIIKNVKITGKAAIVVDLNTGKILFEKSKKLPLPLASITKIMSILVASEHLQPNDIIAWNGEEWRFSDLLDIALVTSSNEATEAISLATARNLPNNDFVEAMNKKAETIGLKQTKFINETGLDLNLRYAGSYGTAEDVAKLFAYTVKNHSWILSATNDDHIRRTALSGLSYDFFNTNKITSLLPGLRASKTGYTDIADGNLAVVIDRGLNQSTVLVVLGSTREERFTDIEKLTKALFQ